MYLTMSMAINVNGAWFLPFQQYKYIETQQVPLVPHTTRSGHKLLATLHAHKHYLIERDGVQYLIPAAAGTLVDFEIPEEYVNRYDYVEKSHSDNITDYIKAAAQYLGIEIRYQIEFAGWYVNHLPKKQKDKVSPDAPKDVKEDKGRDKTLS